MLNALREWKLQCPKGRVDLVFPNGKGNIEAYNNIVTRRPAPTLIAAGVCHVVKDDDGQVVADEKGEPVKAAKYAGMHSFRRFFASWCINRKKDGGLELPPKVVQERLGHWSITIIMDTCGHLFPRTDDSVELATAAAHLFVV